MKRVLKRFKSLIGCVDSYVCETLAPDGKKAVCSQCGLVTNSCDSLPFFQKRVDKPTDIYYCGCRGWN